LMQINSANLTALQMTPEDLFDPCRNMQAGARILAADYAKAARVKGAGASALLAAISAYNTGNFQGGFRNGYVAKVVSNASPSQTTRPVEQLHRQVSRGKALYEIPAWPVVLGGIAVVSFLLYRSGLYQLAQNGVFAGVRGVMDVCANLLRYVRRNRSGGTIGGRLRV
jgi:hypothetical protein